jgi:FtsP/CotA-like multicopper oxidase with cupredoxin domain
VNSIDRRSFLRAGLTATALGTMGVTAACSAASSSSAPPAGSGPQLIGPDNPLVAKTEAARPKTGRVVPVTLDATAGPVDLGGVTVRTWSYGGQIPGPEIRVRQGDQIQGRLRNALPAPTTVHWHGIAIANNMDGVPVITQPPVAASRAFTYQFTAENSGTYWYHPHIGTQLDRGLYGPLIVEDPDEPAPYDHDWTVVLDDWIDGTGCTPDQVLADLRGGMSRTEGSASASPAPSMPGMGGMGGSSGPLLSGASSPLLGGDAGDVRYRYYLVNGRIPAAPPTFTARPRQRVRIRFINAGADTAFRVAVGGHTMTVTHADGYPVRPVETGALLIAQGERYDVQVTLDDGAFPLVALAEGKNALARAIVRTGAGAAPPVTARPPELSQVLRGYGSLRPASSTALPWTTPGVTHRLELTGTMARYNWGIDGKSLDMSDPGPLRFLTREGQRVRVVFANTTTMYHPMHVHGHTFALAGSGTRKDTVIVLPGQEVACDFDASNPGQWLAHCHNLYHATESGMMAVLGYQA